MTERKSFDDMLFSGIRSQSIVVNPGVPRYVVTLKHDGFSQFGEQGRVMVTRHQTLITGNEPNIDEIVDKAFQDEVIDGKSSPNIIFEYSGPLDKAQGYAQGMLDGLQIALGLAGRTATPR